MGKFLKLSAVYALAKDVKFDIVVHGELRDVVKLMSDLGYEGIELNIQNPFHVDVTSLRKVIEDFNLGVAAISTGLSYLTYGYSLSSPNKELRSNAIKFFKKYIELSVDLNSKKVVIGLARGRCNKDVDCSRAKKLLRESLEVLNDYARHHNVILLFEPLNRYETKLVNKLSEALELIRGLSNVKILLDTFHALLEERNVYDAIEYAGPYLGHVHVADSNRLAPGLGMIDWERVVYRLLKVGYRGYLSVEARTEPSFKDMLIVSIKTLRPLLL